MNAFLSLSVLGVVRMNWIPLACVCTAIPAVMSTMDFFPVTVASSMSLLTTIFVPVSYVFVLLSPVQVGASTFPTDLTFPSVGVGLVACPAVVYKADVIRFHLFT